MEAFFNGEDITALEKGISWDPSLFNTDRDGNANLHPLGANSTAPTRGNSPAPSLKDSQPTNNEQEDRDLAKALAMSTEQEPFGGWVQQQETGTISNGGAEFRKIGPETEQQHREGQWGMVLHNSSELIPDVSIEDRFQHEVDTAPRFLKHTLDGDYISNLITICNSIPVAREAFLVAGKPLADYGYEAEWWKGASIAKPRIVDTEAGTAEDQETDTFDEFVAELHRLTAFFDSSARVYASVGGLTETKAMRDRKFVSDKASSLENFLLTFAAMAEAEGGEQADQIAGLFMTRVRQIGDDNRDKTTVLELKSSCPDTVSEESKPDLLACLDRLVWNTDSDEADPTQFCLERPANILVMRIDQEDKSASHLNVIVPPTLVMDKYLEENVPATRDLREQLVQYKSRIKKITDVENKLKYWSKDGKQLDSQQLLKHTHGHFSGQNRKVVDDTDKTNSVSLSADQPPHYQDVAKQLETVMASIDAKLKILAEEKAKAKKVISDSSKTTISSLEGQESQYRYTLRGVATKPNITYVLRPKASEEDGAQATEHNEEMKDVVPSVQDEENTTPVGFQWWRIDYEVSGQTAKITRNKADDFDVIRAVELEHNSALLVYASDDAVDDVDPSELPLPLKDFIRRDNEEFQANIEATKRNPPPPYQPQASDQQWDGVRPSVESRERDDDNDSNSSMVAQHNGNDYERREHINIMDNTDDQMQTYLNSMPENISYMDGVDPNADPEPIDIHLDDLEPSSSTQVDYLDGSGDREMEEKKGMPSLIPAPGTSTNQLPAMDTSEDIDMSGMGESQDLGVGGATSHVEQVRKGG